jgi:hypothetical protein
MNRASDAFTKHEISRILVFSIIYIACERIADKTVGKPYNFTPELGARKAAILAFIQ